MIGFRDVYKTHGLVEAIFEKGSWMVLLIGGFASAYEFLKNGAEFGAISTISLAVTGIGVLMVIVLLAHFEKMGWGIALLMGPLESVGLLPKVVSYVRLFAVGVVGVKIAATGNEMIYEGMAQPCLNSGHRLDSHHVHRLDPSPTLRPSAGHLQSKHPHCQTTFRRVDDAILRRERPPLQGVRFQAGQG